MKKSGSLEDSDSYSSSENSGCGKGRDFSIDSYPTLAGEAFSRSSKLVDADEARGVTLGFHFGGLVEQDKLGRFTKLEKI